MGGKAKCNIVSVGKRRDGGKRYWCLSHKADATAKYGRRARKCRHANLPPVRPNEIITVDVAAFKGGIAVWGAVAPVYDTTTVSVPLGVHVHARKTPDSSEKEIDHTFREVRLRFDRVPEIVITECDAVYHMVSRVFGFRAKYVVCTLCGHPHLDKDWFSVHEHQTHLCAGCGRHFRDTERRIGNPIAKATELLGHPKRETAPAGRSLETRQGGYKGGLQIWGSNLAIVWTANRSEEEGIHLHAFDANGAIVKDDTYSQLVIDGYALDPTMIRVLMAQNSLPHIAGRVVSVSCPSCGASHFDTGEEAFTPHEWHVCHRCGEEFRSGTRFRRTIGNPAVQMLRALEQSAPTARRIHETTLLVEKISGR